MAEHDPAVVEAPAEPPPDVCMLSDTAHECQPLQLEPVEEHEDDAAAKRSRVGSEEDEEEGLVLLPRHTKVVVTGNNRTKSALVGLHGVVQKAVGLGGWHWLTLQGGTEVRLQRNALTVLENPPPELTALERHDEVEDRPQVTCIDGSAAAAAIPARRQSWPRMTYTHIRYLFPPSHRSLARLCRRARRSRHFFLGPTRAARQPMRNASMGDEFDTKWLHRECTPSIAALAPHRPRSAHLSVFLTRAIARPPGTRALQASRASTAAPAVPKLRPKRPPPSPVRCPTTRSGHNWAVPVTLAVL